MVPQTAHAIEVVWGTKLYKATNEIVCTEPVKFGNVRDEAMIRINRFINLYKKDFIESELNTIYVCRDLIYHNEYWARGTYLRDKKAVFIEIEDGDHMDVEFVLHHEFSSLVYHKYFSREHTAQWVKNTNYDYRWYTMTDDAETWGDHQLMSNGAICKYATTDLENDFNSIAGFYLTTYTKEQFISYLFYYPRLRNKTDILVEIFKPFLR